MDKLVEKLSIILAERKLMLCTAESCTGGMIAAAITDRAGSSAVFERGFITYSNQSKIEMLGVDENILNTYGAVSKECAQNMAQSALKHSHADLSIAVTGIAGPDGGSPHKPVGLVYIAFASKTAPTQTHTCNFKGNRNEIRTQATAFALETLIKNLT